MKKEEFNLDKIVKRIENIISGSDKTAALHEPCFAGNEWSYVKECLDSGWVSSAGKYVERFEKEIAAYTGVKHAVAVVNGTAALHTSLKLLGVSSGDEVLIPALTFVATANAVAYCGAVPHFTDSEEKTLGLNPHKLDEYLQEIAEQKSDGSYNKTSGRKIKAAVPMHTFGHPVDMDPLLEICEKYKIALIEDAAEALGSFYKGKHAGNWGELSILSFNGNKIITTGGGGAILTNNESLARQAKHLTSTAKLPHRWAFKHDIPAYNYRMPNINAALGCAQLEQLEDFVNKKRNLAERYQNIFRDMKGIAIFKEAEFAKSNYWLNALILDKEYAQKRDKLLNLTNDNSIMTRPAWTLMYKLPMYINCPRMDLSIAESLEERIINIPSSAKLGK